MWFLALFDSPLSINMGEKSQLLFVVVLQSMFVVNSESRRVGNRISESFRDYSHTVKLKELNRVSALCVHWRVEARQSSFEQIVPDAWARLRRATRCVKAERDKSKLQPLK